MPNSAVHAHRSQAPSSAIATLANAHSAQAQWRSPMLTPSSQTGRTLVAIVKEKNKGKRRGREERAQDIALDEETSLPIQARSKVTTATNSAVHAHRSQAPSSAIAALACAHSAQAQWRSPMLTPSSQTGRTLVAIVKEKIRVKRRRREERAQDIVLDGETSLPIQARSKVTTATNSAVHAHRSQAPSSAIRYTRFAHSAQAQWRSPMLTPSSQTGRTLVAIVKEKNRGKRRGREERAQDIALDEETSLPIQARSKVTTATNSAVHAHRSQAPSSAIAALANAHSAQAQWRSPMLTPSSQTGRTLGEIVQAHHTLV